MTDGATQQPRPGVSQDELEDRIAEIHLQSRADLLEQEHRLIAAAINLCRIFFGPKGDARDRLLPSSLKALVWCLVPSPAAATVGGLALLTLFVTMHQSSLLAAQNRKIEVQNMLAEADRRSALMFETVAIFDRIDAEKVQAVGDVCTEDLAGGPCWTAPPIAAERKLFRPTDGTVGRLAALTQALRPYRYLTVEDDPSTRCPQDTASPALDATYERLLLTTIQGPGTSRTALTVEQAVRITKEIYRETPLQTETRSRQSQISRLVAFVSGADTSASDVSLNCEASSPERGQLLVALHAAGIDISSIVRGGGNFSYADIPGANLSGIVLNGVSLNGARLPGASFQDAILDEVHFRSADLDGARFVGAEIRNADFEAARIQTFERAGDAPLYFMPHRADNVLVSGIRLYEQSPDPDLFGRFCFTLQLPSAFTLPQARDGIAASTEELMRYTDLSEYGFLVEHVEAPGEAYSEERSVLIFDLGLPTSVLLRRTIGGRMVTVSYLRVGECGS
ncbi:MAG: pentapeptide repeat-containing protein [Pseudomonadota bacterium]